MMVSMSCIVCAIPLCTTNANGVLWIECIRVRWRIKNTNTKSSLFGCRNLIADFRWCFCISLQNRRGERINNENHSMSFDAANIWISRAFSAVASLYDTTWMSEWCWHFSYNKQTDSIHSILSMDLSFVLCVWYCRIIAKHSSWHSMCFD